VLKTPLEAAERIKTESGCCYLPMVEGSEDVVSIPGVGGRLPESVRITDVARIVQPRMMEIFGLVKAELDRRNLLPLLAGGVVLTGGGALVRGAAELAKQVFGLPTRVGYPHRLGGLVEEYQSPVYATGVGLVLYGASVRERGESAQPMGERVSGRGVLSRMRNWFREFF